jgi:polyisoprenoid-binding protein YceI
MMRRSPDPLFEVPVRAPARARARRSALAGAVLATLALAGAPPPALAQEAAYAVDADASTLTVFAYKDGFFSSLGHDHTVAARGVTGSVSVDPARPEGGRVEFTVPAARLEVLDPNASADDRASIQKNMENDVLEVAKHPTISFRSAEARRSARVATGTAVALDVTGDLTLHGTTRRITVPITLRFDDGAVRAAGEVTLDQPDFGIEPYSALLGAVKVRRDVKVAFDVVARKPAK